MAEQRRHSPEFRAEIVEKMLAGENVTALSEKHGLARSMMYRWRDVYRKRGVRGLAPPPGRPERARPGDSEEKLRRRLAELERTVGRQAVEIDFFKGVFKRLNESPKARRLGEEASTRRSGE